MLVEVVEGNFTENKMDSTLTTLIITQSITFVSLVVSETLPLVPGPYQGIVHMFLGLLGLIKIDYTVNTPNEPVIVLKRQV